jgi:hypothetical protein
MKKKSIVHVLAGHMRLTDNNFLKRHCERTHSQCTELNNNGGGRVGSKQFSVRIGCLRKNPGISSLRIVFIRFKQLQRNTMLLRAPHQHVRKLFVASLFVRPTKPSAL